MAKEKILVIGASGQIGVELTLALRKRYGAASVVASDLREENELLRRTGPYVSLDVMNKEMLHVQVIRQNVTQIYLLAAILSATGEKNPALAWHLNMQGLLNVLEIAREEKLTKVYWPSSIAVFGPTSPKKLCPQRTVTTEKRETTLLARGRHDPCVLPRAVPMVEAMAALVLCDHALRQRSNSDFGSRMGG